MVVANHTTITCDCNRLSYEQACRIADRAGAAKGNEVVRIELDRVVQTTTAALARLILLRRNLLKSGRDLRIAGLRGQAADLYEFNGMASLLPRRRQGDN